MDALTRDLLKALTCIVNWHGISYSVKVGGIDPFDEARKVMRRANNTATAGGMIPFLNESDALTFAERFASGPFSVLLTSVVTGRHSIGRTWEGMKAAGYPRDWFLWGYQIHDRHIPGRGL